MYNLNNHYDNIRHLALQRFSNPRIDYFMPFGTTAVENIESIVNEQGYIDCNIFCYDQEPLIRLFNLDTFLVAQTRAKVDNLSWSILLNTELDSEPKEDFLKRFRLIDCYYFHHALAASDWFRGAMLWPQITPITSRQVKNKFITFNRLTSNLRVYRSLLVSELVKYNLLEQGLISYSKSCPLGRHYTYELEQSRLVPDFLASQTIKNLNTIKHELRIDYKDKDIIPNQSFNISCIPECMETFLYIVTETCYWGRKKHLTEKIFKPIVCKMPFILVGPAHNLAYLRSYGFKTFDRWIDESYDSIENDVERMHAIGDTIKKMCSYTNDQLTDMLHEMEEVLTYNFERFFSNEFVSDVYNELVVNFHHACDESQRRNA
jgi:hypothetical protein